MYLELGICFITIIIILSLPTSVFIDTFKVSINTLVGRDKILIIVIKQMKTNSKLKVSINTLVGRDKILIIVIKQIPSSRYQ